MMQKAYPIYNVHLCRLSRIRTLPRPIWRVYWNLQFTRAQKCSEVSMGATLLRFRRLLMILLTLCLQARLVQNKLRSVTCTYEAGQTCTDTLKRHQLVGRDGWSLTKATTPTPNEHFARGSCSHECEATLPVWRHLYGSKRPMYLSFYYNIWTLPGGEASSPPVLKIFACRENPNLVSNITSAAAGSNGWQGVVVSLVCPESFDVSFVATLTSGYHRVAVDNIALTYGFSTRDILPAPSYDVIARPGTTVRPDTGSTRKLPSTRGDTTESAWDDGTTEYPYPDEVPYMTLVMMESGGRRMEDHAAFKPTVIMLFILVVCVTTITVHLLICRNQRQIDTRLRRTPITVITPPSIIQKKPTPDTFTSSYSSNHGSEPRSVSFGSKNGAPFPGEKCAVESPFSEFARRRQSIACVERSTKPSQLRPNGRANTTPAKPNDEYYESIDGSTKSLGKGGPIDLLRKISFNRLPRFLENRRSSSTSDMKKKSLENNSSRSPSMLSVASVSIVRHSGEIPKDGAMTPPLPPRTYPLGGEKLNCKSASKPIAINTLPRSNAIQSNENDRRWSEIIPAPTTLAPFQTVRRKSSEHMNGSQQSINTIEENSEINRINGEVLPDEKGHGYYILEKANREGGEPGEKSCTGSLSDLDGDRISSQRECSGRRAPTKEAYTNGTREERFDSDISEGHDRGSLSPGFGGDHGYHVLEKQDSLCSSNISHPDERGYDGDISSVTESNAYQSLGGSFSSQHTYQSLEQQTARLSCGSARDFDSADGDSMGMNRHSLDGESGDGNVYVQLSPSPSSPNKGQLTVSSSFEQYDYRQLVRAGEEILNVSEGNEDSGGYDHINREMTFL